MFSFTFTVYHKTTIRQWNYKGPHTLCYQMLQQFSLGKIKINT